MLHARPSNAMVVCLVLCVYLGYNRKTQHSKGVLENMLLNATPLNTLSHECSAMLQGYAQDSSFAVVVDMWILAQVRVRICCCISCTYQLRLAQFHTT
jgi:hypothetical protein